MKMRGHHQKKDAAPVLRVVPRDLWSDYWEGVREYLKGFRSGEAYFQFALAMFVLTFLVAVTGVVIHVPTVFYGSVVLFLAAPVFWLIGLDLWRRRTPKTALPSFALVTAIAFLGLSLDAFVYYRTGHFVPGPSFLYMSGFPFATTLPLEHGPYSREFLLPPIGNGLYWIGFVTLLWLGYLRWKRWVRGK